MNKAQKEVQQAQLNDEKKVIKLLERVYEQAKKDCEQKIRELSARTDLENLQSIIYQKEYQQIMVDQIESILYDLHEGQFTTIADYLQQSYINGYVGMYYDLHLSGIPLVVPINQDQVVKAVRTDSKLSSGLYTKLGEDVGYLKRSIRAELSRGIASGSTWNEMALRIAKGMNSPFNKAINNAIRIARTEGHRIQNEAALDGQHDEYMKILTEHSNTSLQKLYAKYADKINGVAYGKNGYYTPRDNKLVFSYPAKKYIDGGKSKYGTLAHEYGHYFDAKANYDNTHFSELDLINGKVKWCKLSKVASSSDEFLVAVRKDRDFLKSILTDEVKEDFRNNHASVGVQDAIDGLLGERIAWGHGDKYYNRQYSSMKRLKEHKGLQAAYKELGIDASNLSKVANECRVYESASEMWANIMGAEVNGGSELEYVKKYLPNSYEAFIEILKGVK